MDITDLPGGSQPQDPRKKTALEKLREEMQRQLVPIRLVQEMQGMMRRDFPVCQARDLLKQFEPERHLREVLERNAIPKQIREMLDSTSFTDQVQRMLGPYLPKNQLTAYAHILRSATGLDAVTESAKAYEKYLVPLTVQQEWLVNLQRQALGELSVQALARPLDQTNPAFAAMEAAKRSLDTLWSSFQGIDFGAYSADEEMTQEAEAAAKSITQSVSGESTLQEAVDQIIAAIEVQHNPTVQLMLFLFFRKVLDWLIAGAIGAVMGYYSPQVLGESPQAASKAVKEFAREAVGMPELLVEYRYISVKILIVRQNPRSLSPEMGRLTLGNVVKLVKKEKDFALVLWTDGESGAELQGWVFSRYLGKFN